MTTLLIESEPAKWQVNDATTITAGWDPAVGEIPSAQCVAVPCESWSNLVAKINCGDPSGMEELYHVFQRGVRLLLCRQLGPQDLDDRVHEAFCVVVRAIVRGELREPEKLMGFVRTIVRRQVAAEIDRRMHSRRREVELEAAGSASPVPTPEEMLANSESKAFVTEILNDLSSRGREVLLRFYIQEQSQEQICREMGLTETQFRLLKSRAKERFGELGRRRLRFASLTASVVSASSRPKEIEALE